LKLAVQTKTILGEEEAKERMEVEVATPPPSSITS
jgi:hypothetical protein